MTVDDSVDMLQRGEGMLCCGSVGADVRVTGGRLCLVFCLDQCLLVDLECGDR